MGHHVLVVDDDPLVLEVARRALATADRRVTVARRVSIARDILMRERVDLVLTDARLPGESGLALAETTRALGIATIVMSGDHEWMDERGLGRDAYLEKPFSLQRLVELVNQCASEAAGSTKGPPAI